MVLFSKPMAVVVSVSVAVMVTFWLVRGGSGQAEAIEENHHPNPNEQVRENPADHEEMPEPLADEAVPDPALHHLPAAERRAAYGAHRQDGFDRV